MSSEGESSISNYRDDVQRIGSPANPLGIQSDYNRFTHPSIDNIKRRRIQNRERNSRDLSILAPDLKLLPEDELHCVTDYLCNADFIIKAKIKWNKEDESSGKCEYGKNFVIPVHKKVLTKNCSWFKIAMEKDSNWSDKYRFYNDSELRVQVLDHLDNREDQFALVEYLKSFYNQMHNFLHHCFENYISPAYIYRHADYFNDTEAIKFVKAFCLDRMHMNKVDAIIAFRVDHRAFGNASIEYLVKQFQGGKHIVENDLDDFKNILCERNYKFKDIMRLFNHYRYVDREMGAKTFGLFLEQIVQAMDRKFGYSKKFADHRNIDYPNNMNNKTWYTFPEVFVDIIMDIKFDICCDEVKYATFNDIMRISTQYQLKGDEVGKIYMHLKHFTFSTEDICSMCRKNEKSVSEPESSIEEDSPRCSRKRGFPRVLNDE